MRLQGCGRRRTPKAWCQVCVFLHPCFTSLVLDAVRDDQHPDFALRGVFCFQSPWTSLCIIVCCRSHVSSRGGQFQTPLWAIHHSYFQNKKLKMRDSWVCPVKSQELCKLPLQITNASEWMALTSLTREGLRTPMSHSCSALLSSCIWGNEAWWSYTLDLISKCKVLGGNEAIHTPEVRILCTIFVHYFDFSHWEIIGQWFILKESKVLNHDLLIIC